MQKRVGWHTLRHSFGNLMKSQGAHVAITQALLRNANVSIMMDCYVQAVNAGEAGSAIPDCGVAFVPKGSHAVDGGCRN